MKFNQKIFFDNYRVRFGKLNYTEVDGLASLLNFVEQDTRTTMVRQFAYMLATVKKETGQYHPIKERRAGMIRNPKVYAAQSKYWGSGFYGRGYVQLTWEKNYWLMGRSLRGLTFKYDGESVLTVADDTFVKTSDLVMIPSIAYQIMSVGMHEGLFTGKKLSDYIQENTPPDYLNARRIINGTDCAAEVAGYASLFELCLRASRIEEVGQ